MPARLPEVNKHVNVFYFTGGSNVEVRQGTITAVTDINTVTVRIRRSGQTFAALPRKNRNPLAGASYPVWTPM